MGCLDSTHPDHRGERSRGQVYGLENQSTFYFDKKTGCRCRPASKDLWNGLSFPNILVENGRALLEIRSDIDPRTGLGFTQDGKYAILVAVDGVESRTR